LLPATVQEVNRPGMNLFLVLLQTENSQPSLRTQKSPAMQGFRYGEEEA